MIEFKQTFFNVGDYWTYKYIFNYRGFRMEEYIHCIVDEQIIEHGDLIKIKVRQVHNLEDYLVNRNYENYSERILVVDSDVIAPISKWQ